MNEITHNNLLESISEIWKDITYIKHWITNSNSPEVDKVFNLTELCEYLPDKPVPATVYGWKHRELIPYIIGNSKALMFRKSDIDRWLLSGRPKNKVAQVANAGQFLIKKKIANKNNTANSILGKRNKNKS